MNRTGPAVTLARDVVVAFEDRDDAGALRALRPGFRHCFCLLGRGGSWALCDPLKSHVALALVDGCDARTLAGHLAAEGRTVLIGRVLTAPAGGSGLRPLSCVEIVKRLVGLRAPMVFTPFQLYRRLVAAAPGEPRFQTFNRLDLTDEYE